MNYTAQRDRAQRRLVPTLILGLVLGLGTFAAAGELAVLHSVMAKDAGQAAPGAPCKGGPVGVPCSPGVAGAPARPPAPSVSRIGLEMTPCYQGCPAFTAIFSADGTFTYVGEMNVEHLGEHTGRVDVASLHQVMRLAEETEFAQLDDTYATPFLDNPTSYVMVEWPRDTKVVRADGGAEPVTFWALRELMIDLLETAEWDD